MEIKQDSQYVDEDWWQWSVQLKDSRPELDKVKYVEYSLHPTFPQPVRRISNRDSNFKLETAGWGEFPIDAKVVYKDGSEIKLKHELELKYPSGERTNK